MLILLFNVWAKETGINYICNTYIVNLYHNANQYFVETGVNSYKILKKTIIIILFSFRVMLCSSHWLFAWFDSLLYNRKLTVEKVDNFVGIVGGIMAKDRVVEVGADLAIVIIIVISHWWKHKLYG